jgi:hypothetical protein
MKNSIIILFAFIPIIFFESCKEIYNPPIEVQNIQLLVVEGLLNSGSTPTTIRLSRTVNLKDTATIKPELKAQVSVEGENGSSFTLTGNTKGEYSIAQLPLADNVKYRVHIKTFTGIEYISDFVPVQTPPPIDSISWQRKENVVEPGVTIYVNTHDPQNKTIYYRWQYDETWEFHSKYPSLFDYMNDLVVPRLDPDKILTCWNTSASNRILVGSSAKLAQDVISLAPITTIPFNSIKMSVRYSILIKQYGLTKEAYNYWDILKKNTEQLGTLFDPQPSHLISNIHCVTNPVEQVIGYISAGTTTEKRAFIYKDDVAPWGYFADCADEMQVFPKDYKFIFGGRTLIPTKEVIATGGLVIGYYGGPPTCVDCTITGSNIRPSFW